ncbi:MAG: hypothetical protein KF819_31845 [Labilithrix sp.]|nr:hypothetical protein [Labilithrix sp.]
MSFGSFATGDLVQIETDAIRAIARVRESAGGRLHIALETGEYLPWVDEVRIRHFGDGPERSLVAKMLHGGTTTALLQIVTDLELPMIPPPASTPRALFDTIPDL